MNQVYLWTVSAIAAFLAVATLARLAIKPARIFQEELGEYDRAMIWQIVLFIIFPALNLLSLKATFAAIDYFGGSVQDWSFGMLWADCTPQGISNPDALACVYLAGPCVQLLFALALAPALLFRPHPFIVCLISYTMCFTFALNLLLDPAMCAMGIGGLSWRVAYRFFSEPAKLYLFAFNITAALTFLAIFRSVSIRSLFARLTRPVAYSALEIAKAQAQAFPHSAQLACRLTLAYEQAGLSRQAYKQLKLLAKKFPDTLWLPFLRGYLAYKKTNYKAAFKAFAEASETPLAQGRLRSYFLAAQACSAFAQGKKVEALNLAERALEFDDHAFVARMVKVDVFLADGKKDQAANEVLQFLSKGFGTRDFLTKDIDGQESELKGKIPLDVEKTIDEIARAEDAMKEKLSRQLSRI
jgi:tetratricopeptide (TPR) repeat protein